MDNQVRERAKRWLNEQALDAECAVCRVNDWILGDLTEIDVPPHAENVVSSKYMAIPLICRNCGQMLFFNAIVMGLLDEDELAPEEEHLPTDGEASEATWSLGE